MESAGIDVNVIRPSGALVSHKAEVDLARYLHEGKLSFGLGAMSVEEITSTQESPHTNRVFYTDGGLRDGRGSAAFVEVWNDGAYSYKEIVHGLCSSYRAERRALI